jgi:hypothetical protein
LDLEWLSSDNLPLQKQVVFSLGRNWSCDAENERAAKKALIFLAFRFMFIAPVRTSKTQFSNLWPNFDIRVDQKISSVLLTVTYIHGSVLVYSLLW